MTAQADSGMKAGKKGVSARLGAERIAHFARFLVVVKIAVFSFFMADVGAEYFQCCNMILFRKSGKLLAENIHVFLQTGFACHALIIQ